MVRHLGMTDGPEIDLIVEPQPVERVARYALPELAGCAILPLQSAASVAPLHHRATPVSLVVQTPPRMRLIRPRAAA